MTNKIINSRNLIVLLLLIIAGLTGALVQSHMLAVRQPETQIVYEEVYPTPTTQAEEIPSVVSSNTDNARAAKQAAIDSIDESISFELENQKEILESHKKAVETMKQCKSEWCFESLKQEAEDLQQQIDESNAKIEQLKLQRAILTAGL